MKTHEAAALMRGFLAYQRATQDADAPAGTRDLFNGYVIGAAVALGLTEVGQPSIHPQTLAALAVAVFDRLRRTLHCSACAEHYGDDGICDEGKPAASPHRAQAVQS